MNVNAPAFVPRTHSNTSPRSTASTLTNPSSQHGSSSPRLPVSGSSSSPAVDQLAEAYPGHRSAEDPLVTSDPAQTSNGAATATQPQLPSRGGRGKRRQQRSVQSLNHLLNFTLPARQPPPPNHELASQRLRRLRRQRAQQQRDPYRKERFINANYRFLLNPLGDYTVQFTDPDTFVPWNQIEQVLIDSHQPPTCPICLEVPVAPRVTKCGHIFCLPCVLRYLSTVTAVTAEAIRAETRRDWKKCPICWDSIYAKDLKSARMWTVWNLVALDGNGANGGEDLAGGNTGEASLTVPDSATLAMATAPSSDPSHRHSALTLRLVQRGSNEVITLPADQPVYFSKAFRQLLAYPPLPWDFMDDAMAFAKLLLASPRYMASEVRQDLAGLNQVLLESEAINDTATATVYRDCIARLENDLKAYQEGLASATVAPREELVRQVAADTHGSSGDYEQIALASTIASSDDGVDWLQFFQANDGQHIYLHPLDWRVLQHEYNTVNPGPFPQELSVTVEDRQETTMTEGLRQRCPYLSHLPLGCDLVLIEVNLQRLVSAACYHEFANTLSRREKQRVKRRDQERAEQLAVQRQHDRQLQQHLRDAAAMARNYRHSLTPYTGDYDEWTTPAQVQLDTASFPTIEQANEREAAETRARATATDAFFMDDDWLPALAESDVADDHLKPAIPVVGNHNDEAGATTPEPPVLSFAAAAQQRQAQQDALNHPPSWDDADFPTIGGEKTSRQQTPPPGKPVLVPRLLTNRTISGQSTSPLQHQYDDATLCEALERRRTQATNGTMGNGGGDGGPGLSASSPQHDDDDDDYRPHPIGSWTSLSHQGLDDHTNYDEGDFFYEDDDYADDIEAHGFDFRVNAGPIQRASSSHSRKSGTSQRAKRQLLFTNGSTRRP
ncbi:hypothetical protein H4R35_006051 [Dimargaris xerosporica]|nr:hypothetical protein H4R35_006051 [Dimargaris xerosporica]